MDVRTARFADLDAAELYAVLKLRCEVFVVEQHAPYLDIDGRDAEPATLHLWLEEGGAPVSYLRVLADGDTARIGRVCTAGRARGRGLAGRLMRAALDVLEPGTRCVLDAQTDALGFYRRFGFEVAGTPYFEDDIEHVLMSNIKVYPTEPAPIDE
jgi:ElaA protein